MVSKRKRRETFAPPPKKKGEAGKGLSPPSWTDSKPPLSQLYVQEGKESEEPLTSLKKDWRTLSYCAAKRGGKESRKKTHYSGCHQQ